VRRGGDCPSPGRCRVRRLLLFEQGLRRRLPARSRDARVWRHRSVGCQGHAPVAAVLAPVMKTRQTSSFRYPKASVPGTRGYFSCKAALSEGAVIGAATPTVDPQQLGLAAPSRERGVVGRGHAPVVAVLLGMSNGGGQISRSRCPKKAHDGALSSSPC
jgi:hypothetical protein